MATQAKQGYMPTQTQQGGALLDFTLNLYKEVLEGDKNVFLSPFSISAALLLASLGAKGDTEVEVRRALGLESLGEKEAHAMYRELQKSLNAQSKGSMTLETANRIFSRKGLNVSPQYSNDSLEYYGSGLELMDFIGDAEGSRQNINKWVEEKTRDKIKDLLPFGIIQADTLMVLVNAIYFKGKWLEPFEENSTYDQEFFLSSNNEKKVKMMHDTRTVKYTTDSALQCSAVEIPYKDSSVSMVLIRPDDVEGLKKLEGALTTSKLESLLKTLSSPRKTKVILGIPKFKLEATYAMLPVLAKLGIKTMFSPTSADFSGMLPDTQAFVSAVIHKAFVEVNEEGTEAAAATAMVMMLGCAMNPTPPPKFILDRPFIFAIRDNASGSVLFMGRYTTPE